MTLIALSGPWTVWSFPPLVVATAIAGLALFLQGWRRLRRRGRPDLAPWGRLALFSAGVAVILLAIVSPIDAVGEGYLQAAHMLQHVLIADLGVVLIVLALRGPLAVFFLPRDLLAPLARARWPRRLLSALLRPRVTVVLWLAVLIAWHVPALYEAALSTRVVHDLQHVSFIVVGLLVWVLLIDPTGHGRLTVTERIGVAAVLLAAGQIISYVMLFSYGPFYGAYSAQVERLLGLSPLTDQKLSGVVMMVEQTATLGAFIAWHLIRQAGARDPATHHRLPQGPP